MKGECGENQQPPTEQPPAEDVCDATHLNLCTTQKLCEAASLYWYNESCNTEPPNQEQISGTGQAETPACTPIDEICDGIDNNCDGQIDEGDVCLPEQPPAEQ